jgi:hypothetical protein
MSIQNTACTAPRQIVVHSRAAEQQNVVPDHPGTTCRSCNLELRTQLPVSSPSSQFLRAACRTRSVHSPFPSTFLPPRSMSLVSKAVNAFRTTVPHHLRGRWHDEVPVLRNPIVVFAFSTNSEVRKCELSQICNVSAHARAGVAIRRLWVAEVESRD